MSHYAVFAQRIGPLDAELDLTHIDDRFWRVLDQFGPFGPDNPRPLFWGRDLRIVGHGSTLWWAADDVLYAPLDSVTALTGGTNRLVITAVDPGVDDVPIHYEFEEGTGNVFEDIGFDKATAAGLAHKADLVGVLHRFQQERGLSQSAFARLVGILRPHQEADGVAEGEWHLHPPRVAHDQIRALQRPARQLRLAHASPVAHDSTSSQPTGVDTVGSCRARSE